MTPHEPTEAQRVLLDPAGPAFQAVPPDTFHARFETTKGNVVMQVIREWSPGGAQRFYNLARNGYYDGNRFFRVLPGFVVQFGIHGAPAVQRAWDGANIMDDPVRTSNARGTVAFATAGPNTRATQLFVNFGDNGQLDGMGFSPIGRIVEGMDVLERLYAGYGEMDRTGPRSQCMDSSGNAYLEQEFPQLDGIVRVSILEPPTEAR